MIFSNMFELTYLQDNILFIILFYFHYGPFNIISRISYHYRLYHYRFLSYILLL